MVAFGVEDVSAADAVGSGVGVGVNEDSVYDAEDSGGGANAESQREDGDRRGDAGLQQEAEGVADVLEDGHETSLSLLEYMTE